MSQDIQQYRQPEATPVGHSGTRVVIQERPAWAISGWIGVLVVAACIAATILLAQGSPAWVAVVPAVAGAVVLTSLIIVQPGHTKVAAVLRELRRHRTSYRPVVDRPAGGSAEPEHSGQELRDQPSEGERR